MIARICLFVLSMFTMFSALVAITPTTAYAACDGRFITFPAWYNGLTDNDCNIKSPDSVGGISSFVLRIAMNLLDIMFQAVAYIAVGYIIWGGFKYITSYGEPNDIVLARQRILNAIIGLVIAMAAVAIVNFVGASLK